MTGETHAQAASDGTSYGVPQPAENHGQAPSVVGAHEDDADFSFE